MNTLILAVPAADETPGGTEAAPPSGLGPIMPLLLGLVLVMMLMPLFNKKEKHRRKRLQEIKKHDQVVTSGGIYGTVMSIDEGTVTLEVAKEVRMRFKRSSIFDVESPQDAAKAAAEQAKKAGAKS